MNIDKSIILEKYLHLAVSNIDGCSIKTDHINFRCNVCGDGKSNRKKRGHLLKSKSRQTFEYFWAYKCFNEGDCPCAGDGNAWSGEKWLKYTSPFLYKDYVKEILTPKNKQKNTKKQEEYIIKKPRKNKSKIKQEKNATKYFLTINSKSKKYKDLINKAIQLCTSRNIPEHIWKKWFISTNGIYKNRLIIPFYDNNNEIYYYQCRSLLGQEPKYLNRIQNKDKALYNIHNIDKSKPVILLEGIIDSLFVDNSIAMLGLSLSEYTENILKTIDVHYLLDNDNAGKTKSKKLLEEGKSVFLWNKFKYRNYKDINDVVVKHGINNFTYEDIKDCFTTNIYDKLYLET